MRRIHTSTAIFLTITYILLLSKLMITTINEVKIMEYTLACKDTGTTCDYVARGATKEALMQVAGKHAKEVHAYTDAQLQDPKTIEMLNSLVKEN